MSRLGQIGIEFLRLITLFLQMKLPYQYNHYIIKQGLLAKIMNTALTCLRHGAESFLRS